MDGSLPISSIVIPKNILKILHNGHTIELDISDRPNTLKELKRRIKKKCYLSDKQVDKMLLSYKDSDGTLMPIESENEFDEFLALSNYELVVDFERKRKQLLDKDSQRMEALRILEKKKAAFNGEDIWKNFKEVLDKRIKDIIEKEKEKDKEIVKEEIQKCMKNLEVLIKKADEEFQQQFETKKREAENKISEITEEYKNKIENSMNEYIKQANEINQKINPNLYTGDIIKKLEELESSI